MFAGENSQETAASPGGWIHTNSHLVCLAPFRSPASDVTFAAIDMDTNDRSASRVAEKHAMVNKESKDFLDLSPELLAMVTSYLPDDDKLKLVEVFPWTRDQITHVKITLGRKFSVSKFLATIKPLKNVKVLTFGTNSRENDRISEDMDAIVKGIAQFSSRIESIKFSLGRDGFDMYRDRCIRKYIESVKKTDPTYDASGFKDVIEYSSELIEKYPDLILKQNHFFIPNDSDLESVNFHSIYALTLLNSSQLNQVLPSVKELRILGFGKPIQATDLSQNIEFIPNVQRVVADLFSVPFDQMPIIFTNFGRLKKLESVHIKCHDYTWPEIGLESLRILLQKSTLKKVVILKNNGAKWRRILTLLSTLTRTGLKHFALGKAKATSSERDKNLWDFKVSKGEMFIDTQFDCPLANLLNRFKRVTKIIVKVRNRRFIQKMYEEFNQIKESRPRNQPLSLIVNP